MKQAIILRSDLEMGRGKAAAQAAHASLEAYKKAGFAQKKAWEFSGQKKVVLKASGEDSLLDIFNSAKKEKMPCSLIRDAGRTQIPAGSITAVAIGPESDDKVDKIVGSLKLY